MFAGMETTPSDIQDELLALRALVAEQAAKLSAQEAEVTRRDTIIDLCVHSWNCSGIASMALRQKR